MYMRSFCREFSNYFSTVLRNILRYIYKNRILWENISKGLVHNYLALVYMYLDFSPPNPPSPSPLSLQLLSFFLLFLFILIFLFVCVQIFLLFLLFLLLSYVPFRIITMQINPFSTYCHFLISSPLLLFLFYSFPSFSSYFPSSQPFTILISSFLLLFLFSFSFPPSLSLPLSSSFLLLFQFSSSSSSFPSTYPSYLPPFPFASAVAVPYYHINPRQPPFANFKTNIHL